MLNKKNLETALSPARWCSGYYVAGLLLIETGFDSTLSLYFTFNELGFFNV